VEGTLAGSKARQGAAVRDTPEDSRWKEGLAEVAGAGSRHHEHTGRGTDSVGGGAAVADAAAAAVAVAIAIYGRRSSHRVGARRAGSWGSEGLSRTAEVVGSWEAAGGREAGSR
jgi:hypothetical protein